MGGGGAEERRSRGAEEDSSAPPPLSPDRLGAVEDYWEVIALNDRAFRDRGHTFEKRTRTVRAAGLGVHVIENYRAARPIRLVAVRTVNRV